VDDALPWVEELESSIDYRALAAAQELDPELRKLRQGTTSLQLKLVQVPDTNTRITCDVSTTAA
jgi:hypothetical protein